MYDESPSAVRQGTVPGEEATFHEFRNNQHFLESLRLAQLAQETFNYGDYTTSFLLAGNASQEALLSDVYVAIAMAKHRIDWAVSSGASRQHPEEFGEAQMWYSTSLRARDREQWEEAIEAANKVQELLAYIKAPEGTAPLPAQYTVRSWVTFRDCFWNIAARPWVYNNPYQWRVLYNANRSKLPNPNNPDIIEPGMVLDIPSIRGETRQGDWDPSKSY
jgi:nucleoid-associated protein YgaU